MRIKIYTTPTCPYCQLAKDFFEKKNLFFEEIDVSQDQKALEEIIEKTHQMAVPVIEIEEEIFVGFNPREIEEALKRKKDK